MRTTHVSLKLAKKEVVRNPITSFYFIQPQNEQSGLPSLQNDTHNTHKSWFKEAFLLFHYFHKIYKETGS